MSLPVRLFPLFLLLCTCGPAQDTPPPTDAIAAVTRSERLFTEAYAHLDAAVMDRQLSEDFVMRYPAKKNELSRTDFLATVAQMQGVFPEMSVSIDSLRVAAETDEVVTRGTRNIVWQVEGEEGGFREAFTNKWRWDGKKWQMYDAEIN